MRILHSLAPIAALGLAAAGCGQPTAEERIADATEQVRLAESELEGARQRAEREEEELAQAREELKAAQQAVRDAETRLEEANQHMAEVADDAYLFRTVQSALLADPELEGLAIAARVRDGVVTLTGEVSRAEKKKRAGAVAAEVAGVKRVSNEVAVELAVE